MSTPNYITPWGLEQLKNEYSTLFHDERPKVVETVAWAAGNGDRSENGDYIYGKRRLRQIDSRLRFLNKRIEAAEVVDPTTLKGEKVIFGATVHVLDEDDNEMSYSIVGEDETEPEKKYISWKSPIAKSLLGKSIGDEVLLKRPAGDISAEITSIEFKEIARDGNRELTIRS